ncbi:ATP-dependent dethiobiotin synthetase BioD [Chitinimonas prasina]|uniref:ATP-dependent dethiobiotin synthetase BioD n=1 Tax=Chitinimonas prasina TaxID=1434937 RepID=A0ABQ5YAR1_9NEIS|nr:dethiobiotin synthase [Chitinimonas prasina]GLR11497.1 ATP-dependent dethiobiotin synthetase BioD [Chitinimonas prasina]
MAHGYFITGTDTEVGKTVATCHLLRAAVAGGVQAVGMKPVASGCVPGPHGGLDNEDVLAHEAAGNVVAPRALTNPYAFVPPVSPHLAARGAGVAIDIGLIQARYQQLQGQAELVLVEGAGGWLAPLDDSHTMADLAVRLGLPVILVVGLRLGCLNHAMLTVAAIAARGLPLAGWVANCVDPAMRAREDNLAYLTQHIAAPCLGVIPNFSAGQKAESNQEQMLGFELKMLIK